MENSVAERVNWKVEGMSCTNCALTIRQYLEQKGLKEIKVNFIGGDVSFDRDDSVKNEVLEKDISQLGYRVVNGTTSDNNRRNFFKSHLQRFLFCLVFTLPLMLHMIPGMHVHALMHPYVQLVLTLPVYIVGMGFFGRSAWNSLRRGIPNMNVLIALGATAAFVYSLYGTITGQGEQFLFYETSAAIFTLVFLGNWLEDRSLETTQAALKQLAQSQKVMANMIAYDEEHNEHVFPVEGSSLKTGDLLLIKTGEQVPADCKILWGEATVNEAIVTGESMPLQKAMNDLLIGGSILEQGTVKTYVTATGEQAVLGNILKMVKDAQAEKPPVQQLADRISAIFVPVVTGIALLTLIINYFFADNSFTESLLRSIAVLVIACPCAMGLATPAAIAVGLGRAARSGVLFRNAKSLELFKDIRTVVFDKTGTLTTGKFSIASFSSTMPEEDFKRIAYSLERYSGHPIATCIAQAWKQKNDIRWKSVEEIKGVGIQATDKEGNVYAAGSYKIAATIPQEEDHNVYITKNDGLIGWIDVADEIRPEAKQVISFLSSKNIETVLLSGDTQKKCDATAKVLGIKTVLSEQSPADKLEKIAAYTRQGATAMVGDGINDAPALAKATIGISISEASQLALQHAQVVLLHHGLKNLPLSLGLGKHTFITIQQNLAWAFLYNIIAIPVAAFGFLSPTFGALVMALSDVVLAINSVRLNFKKVN